MIAALQTFSHYPSWPMPVSVPAVEEDHPCVYFSDRVARIRAFGVGQMGSGVYRRFMDAGFRRSGCLVYQPLCRGCRACMPIRVLADRFTPDKSQRRCRRRNQDLKLSIDVPAVTDEKYQVYRRYVREWHGDGVNDDSIEGFERFLYQSPVDSIELTYRDTSNRFLAAGICDVSAGALSSVYFYFDPADASRGLGTYGALCELDYCRKNNTPHYYLGYWIEGCRSMEYKSNFRPFEVLCTDGIWREIDRRYSDRVAPVD